MTRQRSTIPVQVSGLGFRLSVELRQLIELVVVKRITRTGRLLTLTDWAREVLEEAAHRELAADGGKHDGNGKSDGKHDGDGASRAPAARAARATRRATR